MPSRRDALATLGSAATLSLAGCIDAIHAPAAYCQWKAVYVGWHHDGRVFRDEVVWFMGHPGRVYGRVAEEFPGLASGPRDVVAGDGVVTELERTFGEVDYLLGFCGDAFPHQCRNTDAASREDFNAVQVGDEARVSLVDHEFHVHSVDAADPAAVDGWDLELRRFDLSELHADRDVPLDD